MKKVAFILLLALSNFTSAQNCPSTATLEVTSSGYYGTFDVELRYGSRPGSVVVGNATMRNKDTHTFYGVCQGRYFFAFGTPDSDEVSVTQYFDVENDGYSYSNPVLSVFYTRSTSQGSRVGSAKRGDL